jgi:hypothetical protein
MAISDLSQPVEFNMKASAPEAFKMPEEQQINKDSSSTVSETVRSFFPETWLWNIQTTE